jgi:hypothetical protein
MNIVKLNEDVRERRRYQLEKGSIKNVKRWRRCHIAKDEFIRRSARSMLHINCVFCLMNDSRSINPGSNVLRITLYVLSVIVVLLIYIKNDCGVGNNIMWVFS